jgi:hypothetical protein
LIGQAFRKTGSEDLSKEKLPTVRNINFLACRESFMISCMDFVGCNASDPDLVSFLGVASQAIDARRKCIIKEVVPVIGY